ncbi:MAG: hypothetical protein U5K84_08875 [Alkalibacterium sp.]|nr:hypothetical protein [Alkalibacterium sp.]
MNPMVFCGMYPTDSSKYEDLREALERLQLNDAALQYEAETSQALGFGFRCGFLGMLHMDVVQERLEREFNLDLITTAPSVIYKINKTDGESMTVSNPSEMPEPQEIESHRRTLRQSDDHCSKRLRGRGYGNIPAQTRRIPDDGIP